MTVFYSAFIEWATQRQLTVHLPTGGGSALRCHWKSTGLLALLLDVPRAAHEWPIIMRRLDREYARYRPHLRNMRHHWISGMAPFIWMYNKQSLWGVAYHMGSIPNLIHLSYKNDDPVRVLKNLGEYQEHAQHYIALMQTIVARCPHTTIPYTVVADTSVQSMVDQVCHYQLGCDGMIFALDPARCISGMLHLLWNYEPARQRYSCNLIPKLYMHLWEEQGDLWLQYRWVHDAAVYPQGYPLDQWHVRGIRIALQDAGIHPSIWILAKDRHVGELLSAFMWAMQFRNADTVKNAIDFAILE